MQRVSGMMFGVTKGVKKPSADELTEAAMDLVGDPKV